MKLKDLSSRKIDMARGIVPLADIFMILLLFSTLVSIYTPMDSRFVMQQKKMIITGKGETLDYDPTMQVVLLEATKEGLFHLKLARSEHVDQTWARTYGSIEALSQGLGHLTETFPDRSLLIILESEEDMPLRLYYRIHHAVQEAGLDIAGEGLLDENK